MSEPRWKMHRRQLSDGEQALLLRALLNEASRAQLQQINSDILASMDPDSPEGKEARERLRDAGAELYDERRALEFLALLVSRGRLQVAGPIIIPEVA